MFEHHSIQPLPRPQQEGPRRRGLAEDPGSSPFRREPRASSIHHDESTSSSDKVQFPLHGFSFCSDVSVLSSISGAQEAKAWFCVSCSYRNSDAYHRTCALCGCAQHSAAAASPVAVTNTSSAAAPIMDSSASVSSGTTTASLPTIATTSVGTGAARHTIFTIDSSISILSQPSNRSVSFRSLTSCSRTTGTSHSTKVISNRTNTNTSLFLPASPQAQAQGTSSHTSSRMGNSSGPLQRPRCEDKEEVGSIQPPTMTHTRAGRRIIHRNVPSEQEEDQEEDTVSLASHDTCKAGSLSSGRGDCNASSSSSDEDNYSLCYSQSRNKIVPHEDPLEMEPRHHRRRSKRSHQKHQEEVLGGFAALSPIKPLRRQSSSEEEDEEETSRTSSPTVLPAVITTDVEDQGLVVAITTTTTTDNSTTKTKEDKTSSKKKKKSIADYIPGLRRRRRNKELRSSDNTEPTLSPSEDDSPQSTSERQMAQGPAPSCWAAPPQGEDSSSSLRSSSDCGRSDWCRPGSAVGDHQHQQPSSAVLQALTITARYGENYN